MWRLKVKQTCKLLDSIFTEIEMFSSDFLKKTIKIQINKQKKRQLTEDT